MMLGKKNKKSKINKFVQTGFTLMEVVIALAIFATATIVITDIYIMAQRTQTKLAGQTKVQSDARFVMEVLTREVRLNGIDYDYIASQGDTPSDGLDYLPLKDNLGNTVLFTISIDTADVCSANATQCLAVQKGNSVLASITPEGVNVNSIKFYIYPDNDPFVLDTVNWQYPNDDQPWVTIVLVSETIGLREIEDSISYLQTTVSTRQYKRF